jgi:uncharacterized membrane protein
MDRKLLSVLLSLVAVLIVFGLVFWVVESTIGEDFKLGDSAPIRFLFVGIGLLVVFGVYAATRQHPMWEVGTRQVVYMAIGAALYAAFSYLFNGTVFAVPSVSQVALRPAIAIPMFFGYTFGPVVGFFSGAVGNMFGDALTGFGLSPQWSVGNGLVGMIAGLVFLFRDKKKSMDVVLAASGIVALFGVLLYFLTRNQNISNMMFFDPENNIYGDAPISILAGVSGLVGFILVALVRFAFEKDADMATAVVWGSLGNFLGIGFAAISDIWVNGFTLTVALVGEFLPAAGPNLIFAAILVPALVAAYAAFRRQSGR